jgi:hypothetical protein
MTPSAGSLWDLLISVTEIKITGAITRTRVSVASQCTIIFPLSVGSVHRSLLFGSAGSWLEKSTVRQGGRRSLEPQCALSIEYSRQNVDAVAQWLCESKLSAASKLCLYKIL